MFKYFFIHEYAIEAMGLDIGFKQFGLGHLIWLCAIIIEIVLISKYYKKQDLKKQINIKKFFAIVIIAGEILKDSIIIFINAPISNYLPMHLCSISIFVMTIDAFIRNKRVNDICGQLFAYAFVPGAIAALLCPNWTCYPFFHFMNIYSFLFHSWIIVYYVMLYKAGQVRITYKGLWTSFATMFILGIPIYIFDRIFNKNYMFLNEASEGSPLVFLWDVFGERFGSFGYVLSYIVFVILILHIVYGIYQLIYKIKSQSLKSSDK